VLPKKGLIRATLAELCFDSIAGWLPKDEAAALRDEFHRELDRLYARCRRRLPRAERVRTFSAY
jgi:hypothetical protein